MNPSIALNPGAVLERVARIVASHPGGIACHPSQNSLHLIIGEVPASLDLRHGELLAIAPSGRSNIEAVKGLSEVAWHFTDNDGRAHVTIVGAPEMRLGQVEEAVPQMSPAHQHLVMSHPERFLGPDVLATRIRSIRYEIPERDVNVLFELDDVESDHLTKVASTLALPS